MTLKKGEEYKNKCYFCGMHLSAEHFFKDRSRNNGLSSRCKECSKVVWRINRKFAKQRLLAQGTGEVRHFDGKNSKRP